MFVGWIRLNGDNSQGLAPIEMERHDFNYERSVVLLLAPHEQASRIQRSKLVSSMTKE